MSDVERFNELFPDQDCEGVAFRAFQAGIEVGVARMTERAALLDDIHTCMSIGDEPGLIAALTALSEYDRAMEKKDGTEKTST